LMIHGGMDAYIKPEMARALFEHASAPKEFWLVEGAKHNQALQVAGEAYRQRILHFFEQHLNGSVAPLEPGQAPQGTREPRAEAPGEDVLRQHNDEHLRRPHGRKATPGSPGGEE